MVWTAAQTGEFLDSVVSDRLYPQRHLISFIGLRRGESCALPWSEVDLDEDVIHITRLHKKTGLPPVRPHDLRHGSASLALVAGVHIKVVQQRLGHSSIKVTADIYTSVAEEVEREAAEATLPVVPRSRKKKLPTEEPPPETIDEDDPEDEQADNEEGDEPGSVTTGLHRHALGRDRWP